MERNAERRRRIRFSRERAVGLLLIAAIAWGIITFQAQRNNNLNGDLFPTVYATQEVLPSQFETTPDNSNVLPQPLTTGPVIPEATAVPFRTVDLRIVEVDQDCGEGYEETALVQENMPIIAAYIGFDAIFVNKNGVPLILCSGTGTPGNPRPHNFNGSVFEGRGGGGISE